MYKNEQRCIHPNCECLDICEGKEPFMEAVWKPDKCIACGDSRDEHTTIIGKLCKHCADDTYID